jgi:hypothetical protein
MEKRCLLKYLSLIYRLFLPSTISDILQSATLEFREYRRAVAKKRSSFESALSATRSSGDDAPSSLADGRLIKAVYGTLTLRSNTGKYRDHTIYFC